MNLSAKIYQKTIQSKFIMLRKVKKLYIQKINKI